MSARSLASRPLCQRSSYPSTVSSIVAGCLASLTWLTPMTHAITFTPAPSSNLDLSQLGRVAVAGNFEAISVYDFLGQSENGFGSNGSQALLQQYPTTGAFATLGMADGYIYSMCPFTSKGVMQGVVVGGNFTSLGCVEAQGIALWNPDTGVITPLPGLNGQVSSVYCDESSDMVYVGGSFTGANSSNAIAWTSGWANLPFAGFNGPVTSIVKAPNGHVVFGGSFDGLGNAATPKQKDLQVIPITSAKVTASPSSRNPSFSNPANIVCKTGHQDGPGNSWLLADNVPGFWDARFAYGFVPTKLRLYNTKQQGRGTKTWRFTALPINGILRFTYIDPNGVNKTCDSECPLPQNNQSAQDFHFVNFVGMNQFRIDISAWYGSGGGLSGIELFEDDIYAYAINDFNEPKCDGVSPGTATATKTGPWTVVPSGESTSEYLGATLKGSNISPTAASVVFGPNIRQSGNYSVTVYTPGCLQDNTCATRGRVTISGMMGSAGAAGSEPYSVVISQTNYYDKYDQIYLGFVDMTSDSFKPRVTLTPAPGQDGPLAIVAQRVRFELITSSGGLNGLFEFDPNLATVDTDFSKSAIDTAGSALNSGATVSSMVTLGSDLYVAGKFSNASFDNIFALGTDQPFSLADGGLNDEVATMYSNDGLIYVGGQFTNTKHGTGKGLNHVAVYDTRANQWRALGSGVNGGVTNIVLMQLNFTADTSTPLIAVSGYFGQVLGFGSFPAFAAEGIALWHPGRQNWVHNLGLSSIAISGILSAMTTIPGHPSLYAGSAASAALAAGDAAAIASSPNIGLQPLGANIQPSISPGNSPLTTKRTVLPSSGTVDGATTAIMFETSSISITAVGGHFTATASNGSTVSNVVVINSNGSTTGFAAGVDASSTVLALAGADNMLYAGGALSGSVNGANVSALVLFDLTTDTYATTQPPTLSRGSGSATVNAIAAQPSSSTSVFVGGNFASAGGNFPCPALCIWDASRAQWNSPGSGLGGSVLAMAWVDDNRLLLGGDLTVNGSATSVALYKRDESAFSAVDGADKLPGPVTAVSSAASDGNRYWVAGTGAKSQHFIQKFDGGKWSAATGLGPSSDVQALQVFMLTADHAATELLGRNEALMVLGDLSIDGFGYASAALFDGNAFEPFLLADGVQGGRGVLRVVVVERPEGFFRSGGGRLAVGFVVLIGLAIALVLIFLVVVAGVVAERVRRRKEGYSRAPTQPFFDAGNMSRVPPSELFQSLGRGTR